MPGQPELHSPHQKINKRQCNSVVQHFVSSVNGALEFYHEAKNESALFYHSSFSAKKAMTYFLVTYLLIWFFETGSY